MRELEISNKKEISEIIEIEKEAFNDGAIDEWVLKPFIRYGKVYILEEGTDLIGVAELMKSWKGDKTYLYGFCIKAEYRGKGYASFFLKELLKKLSGRVTLTVSPQNIPAINLYTKHGFIVEKLLKNEYGDAENRYYMTTNLKKED